MPGGSFTRAFHVGLLSCSANPGQFNGRNKVRCPLVIFNDSPTVWMGRTAQLALDRALHKALAVSEEAVSLRTLPLEDAFGSLVPVRD